MLNSAFAQADDSGRNFVGTELNDRVRTFNKNPKSIFRSNTAIGKQMDKKIPEAYFKISRHAGMQTKVGARSCGAQ